MSVNPEAIYCYPPRHVNWLYEFQPDFDHEKLLERLSEMPLDRVTFIHLYKTEDITYVQLHFAVHKSRLYAECYLQGHSSLHVLVRPYSFWNSLKKEKPPLSEFKLGKPLNYTVHAKKVKEEY